MFSVQSKSRQIAHPATAEANDELLSILGPALFIGVQLGTSFAISIYAICKLMPSYQCKFSIWRTYRTLLRSFVQIKVLLMLRSMKLTVMTTMTKRIRTTILVIRRIVISAVSVGRYGLPVALWTVRMNEEKLAPLCHHFTSEFSYTSLHYRCQEPVTLRWRCILFGVYLFRNGKGRFLSW